jgi:hypothetical protein
MQIKVFEAFGIKLLNDFIFENKIQKENIINIETFVGYENKVGSNIHTVKKTTYKLWYWGTDEKRN